MQWELLSTKDVVKTVPFTLEELELKTIKTNEPAAHTYHRLRCADWVNVLPVTSKGEVILIRQSRAGSFTVVLETPGGVVDKKDGDPTMTAKRELEEETGYISNKVLSLGSMNPNPAIMTNRLHMFLALDCYLAPQGSRQNYPDVGEDIEIVLTPLAELPQLVRTGRLDSCLAALTVFMAMPYLEHFKKHD